MGAMGRNPSVAPFTGGSDSPRCLVLRERAFGRRCEENAGRMPALYGDLEDCGGLEAAVLEVLQGAVGLGEGVELDAGLDGNLGGWAGKVAGIGRGAVSNAANGALVVEEVVVEGRNLRHRDTGEGKGAGLA